MQIKAKDSFVSSGAVTRSCVVVIAAGAAVACAGAPVRNDPVAAAAATEQAHCGQGLAEDPRIFAPDVVAGVAPVMRSHRMGKSEPEVLAGVEIAIPAQPGLTTAWITRNLICHQAHQLLRQAADSQDAYWLPGAWLEFDVHSRGDVFLVDIYAADPDSANAVLTRSRAFVANRGAAIGPAAL